MCAGVVIKRKIPAKNIVWDSEDQDLIRHVEYHNYDEYEGYVERIVTGESEVVVVDLPRYRLDHKRIEKLYLDTRDREDKLREIFDLPEWMLLRRFQPRNILEVDSSDIKDIKVRG